MRIAILIVAAICGIAVGFLLDECDGFRALASGVIGDARLLINAEWRRAGVDKKRVKELTSLLRSQARDDAMWAEFLRESHLNEQGVYRLAANWLGQRDLVDTRVAKAVQVTGDECRNFYEAHRQLFMLPARLRVSHIFVAAPPQTPAELVTAKKRVIDEADAALKRGSDFGQAATVFSEDEATMNRGGDLGWISERRVPADFLAMARKLQIGETSAVIRTTLGFHILRVTDAHAPRELSFADVERDIQLLLANSARARATAAVTAELVAKSRSRR